MRERASEILALQEELHEKVEQIQVLDNQLELLRKQLMTLNKTNTRSPNRQSTGDDQMESRETQTSQHSNDSRTTTPTRRRRKRGGCCTIS